MRVIGETQETPRHGNGAEGVDGRESMCVEVTSGSHVPSLSSPPAMSANTMWGARLANLESRIINVPPLAFANKGPTDHHAALYLD